MKTKVLYTTDFGTRLWIGTDYGYCGSSIQGIHQGRIVNGRCRDLKDSFELKYLRQYSDLVRLATVKAGYSRGFGYQETLFPITEDMFNDLLMADRQIAAEKAAEAAAAAAAQRAAEIANRKAVVAAAVRSRIGARRSIPAHVPVAAANIITVPASPDFRAWAHHIARMMHNNAGQLILAESGIG